VGISVRAIGVNPIDWKSYSGTMGNDPSRLPKRLGNEAAGVVSAVGPDVDTVSVGDEVIAYRAAGSYAADVVVPLDAIIPKPPSLPWDQAAGLMLTGVTAVHALTVAAVGPGDTVLIHGAAGGVGLIAVQLAVLRGATVIATGSPSRHELLREFGATPVAYGAGLDQRVRTAAPQGITAALDLVGTDEAVDTSLSLVADAGRIVTIAAFSRAGSAGITAIGGAPGADPGTEIRLAARAELADLAGSGKLRVVVGSRYPLAEAAAAHRESIAGHTAGKIILVP
jgi:NADPH2:quinone reductase